MTYEQYVKDVFVEHHVSMGLDTEEAEDRFNEVEFTKVEKWLTKCGYDLNEYKYCL
jgi:hypothetical protein